MALTPSNMLNLGTVAPDFSLIDTRTAKITSLSDCKGAMGTLVMFICNHCPYVIHVMPEIMKVRQDYPQVGFVAISSNDVVSYPQDGPDKMREFAKEWNMDFPYLFDETQQVAKAYDAACTPDFYLFNAEDKLVYRGRLDESRPRTEDPKPLTGKDLRGAINALLAGEPLSEIQFPSMGCNIKWKV
ncbi:thioredoxin family protein [Leadbetterella byssophila]|jgi:peroxiredoxin|uniref:Alkyl hydroperoxide reductase/ Thiol specific antioxidant/ Mal allergen n=1 Tax=Leadbetterella byssophila (strain DSM 17132 / JCM 16389 / KACC 11308 / NBRC 106382 / 4M15) TaxID=649349 RepID=E4RV50_LEAB4|nr:thioredoxin family protein [Leadbetterella byssophila]ADQ18788.1 alkyl hydroperoxide reductase/ Thiol specific antioxidant/ Mal allergen [Leadbetterella byssophila DSM 17132]